MKAILFILVASVAVAPSGCNSVKCGPGTYQQGDNCIAYDPNDHTPPMTTIAPVAERSRSAVPDPITLVSNEPATVYYTTDGTDPDPTTTTGHRDMATIRALGAPQTVTIKYFSIDTAGNREATQTATFVQDVTGPAPVTAMAVSIVNGTAHVTWTNPTDSDYAGTAIARVADVVDGAPTDGQMPVLMDSVTASLQIVSVGSATSFDDPGVKAGDVRYVAWAYDDLGNYSAATVAGATVPLGSLDAVLQYDTTTSALTIMQQPVNIDISTTTAAFSSGTLTLNLVAKNQTVSYLNNPKVEVTGVTGATFSNSDGTADTFPFKALGASTCSPAPCTVFPPGTSAKPTLTFTTSGTTITINLHFASHPSVIARHGQWGYYYYSGVQLADSGTGAAPGTQLFQLQMAGPSGRTGGQARPPLVVGGHFVDVPTTHDAIERYDLVTGKAVSATTIVNTDRATLQGLIGLNGGELAIVKLESRGRSRYNEKRLGTIELVKMDEAQHVLTTVMYTFTDSSGACQPALSPDGSTLAIASDTAVALVDTRTLAQIDSDPGTPDPDVFVPASMGRVGTIVWLNNTDFLVLTRKNGQAAVVKRVGNTYTTSLVYNDMTVNGGGYGAAMASDGKVWLALPSGVKVYDPVGGTVTALPNYTPTAGTQGVARLGSQMWVLHGDHLGFDLVANDGTLQKSFTIPGGNAYQNGIFGHWLATTP